MKQPVINFIIFVSVFFSGCTFDVSQSNQGWGQIKSAKDLWEAYPGRVRTLMRDIDTSMPQLRAVRVQLEEGDTVEAAESLVRYFSESGRDWVLSALDTVPGDVAEKISGLLSTGIVTISDDTARVPVNADMSWQWDFTGPDGDDEFGYSLNSHRYLTALYFHHLRTQDPLFVETFDRIIKDWIIRHPLPEQGDSIYFVLDAATGIDYRDIGEVEWRTLEAGQRLGATWPQLFYAFQKEPDFSNATRLLMLSSVNDQANYLHAYHKNGHNWTTMEMNGLALAGMAFPEFKKSGLWRDYALKVMSDEINRQVYPDGVQTEISSKTQWVALKRFESIADNKKKTGRDVGEDYWRRLEDMYGYLAYCMRPDGHQPLNSDSDREDLRQRILVAAEKYDRDDWKYIATNGAEGTEPEMGPSVTFPWAGIQISRNGWHEDAHWSFFDFGPYGTGHQHRDKLHLSISAYGDDLLVDGGRYTHQDYFSFDPKIWRGYFRSTFSHNTILMDGQGQKPGMLRTEEPLKEGGPYIQGSNFDYTRGTFEDGYEDVEGMSRHTRSVLYLHDQYWLVLDQIETDRPRDIQTLWHFAPHCEVTLSGQTVHTANDNRANLKIIPIGDVNWDVKSIKGQESPYMQGWYSETYGKKEVNNAIIYHTKLDRSAFFAWLLIPSRETAPDVDVEYSVSQNLLQVSVQQGDRSATITMPLNHETDRIKVDMR